MTLLTRGNKLRVARGPAALPYRVDFPSPHPRGPAALAVTTRAGPCPRIAALDAAPALPPSRPPVLPARPET